MTLDEATDKVVETVNDLQGVKGAELSIRVPLDVIQSGLFMDALARAIQSRRIVEVNYTLPDNANPKAYYLPGNTRVQVS